MSFLIKLTSSPAGGTYGFNCLHSLIVTSLPGRTSAAAHFFEMMT